MAVDGLLLGAAVDEVQRRLAGSRVIRVDEEGPEQLALHLYGPGGEGVLRISVAAHAPCLFAAGLRQPGREARRNRPSGEAPGPFANLLRQRLQLRRLAGVEQQGADRIVRLRFVSAEAGQGQGEEDGASAVLFAELFGRSPDLILCDGDSGVVQGALRHGGERGAGGVRGARGERDAGQPDTGEGRLALGQPYRPPEPVYPGATGGEPLDRSRWERTLRLLPPSAPVEKGLVQLGAGAGPLTAREVAFRAGLLPGTQRQAMDQDPTLWEALWRAWTQLLEDAREGRFRFTMLVDPDGAPSGLCAFELTHVPPDRRREYPSAGALLDDYLEARAQAEQVARERRRLGRVVSTLLKRARRKAEAQEVELRQAGEAEQLRRRGELLMANLHNLEPGAAEARVPDYHQQGQEVRIPLDPALTPAQNAQAYFLRYRKAQRAQQVLARELERARDRIAWLEELELALEAAESLQELEEVGRELARLDPALRPSAPAAPPGRRQPGPPAGRRGERGDRSDRGTGAGRPLEFLSSDGYVILAGKNNRQNEALTRSAADEDLWLHARQMPGSHVIVRTAGRHPVPECTLLEAAGVAARYSKGRDSTQVPVDYTLRKHVRKPPGTRPGFVTYDRYRTIFVNPDRGPMPRRVAEGGARAGQVQAPSPAREQ